MVQNGIELYRKQKIVQANIDNLQSILLLTGSGSQWRSRTESVAEGRRDLANITLSAVLLTACITCVIFFMYCYTVNNIKPVCTQAWIRVTISNSLFNEAKFEHVTSNIIFKYCIMYYALCIYNNRFSSILMFCPATSAVIVSSKFISKFQL